MCLVRLQKCRHVCFPSCLGFCGVAYSCIFGFGRFRCFYVSCFCLYFVEVLFFVLLRFCFVVGLFLVLFLVLFSGGLFCFCFLFLLVIVCSICLCWSDFVSFWFVLF